MTHQIPRQPEPAPPVGTSIGPSFAQDEERHRAGEQTPVDIVEEESMESFPCSDPPSYSTCHA